MPEMRSGLGQGVHVLMVDNGVRSDTVQCNPFDAKLARTPFLGDAEHGTKMAAIVKQLAPEATIFDLPLLPIGSSLPEFLEAARLAYEGIGDRVQKDAAAGIRWIVVNCWSAPNHPDDNYSSDAKHAFTLAVERVIKNGADVLFAAGNCGGQCGPSDADKCGLTGEGQSISGANSHPDAITVSAVTVPIAIPGSEQVYEYWWGYSSIGPGTLSEPDGKTPARKPDLCAPSIFVLPLDVGGRREVFRCGGTSSSTAVCAGMVAALRSQKPARDLTPSQLKSALLKNARAPVDKATPGQWDPYFGFGIPDYGATLGSMGFGGHSA